MCEEGDVGLSFAVATPADVTAITALRNAVAERLDQVYGRGHWSSAVTEKSVLRGVQTSRVLLAREGGSLVATLRLATKKPWAIDPAYFRKVSKALYLTDMAVEPPQQLRGLGRSLLDEAQAVARAWPSEAIRLDAYDASAGAGQFYAKCGFREVGRVTYRNTPLIYYELVL